jgi:hypothetical protein
MDELIIIKGYEIKYTPVERFWERCGSLNREILKNDFLDLKHIFDKNELLFSLTCGTLLGAVRERNFIEHDIDIDIIIKEEEKLLGIIPEIEQEGFKFIRYQDDKKYTIYTFIRNNVPIDIYIAIPIGKYYYLWGGKIRREFVDEIKRYEVFGEYFLIPKGYRKLLVILYGRNWKTPIENKPGYEGINQDKIVIRFYIKVIKKILPYCIKEKIKRTSIGEKIKEWIKNNY